jgi:hypothetical protein
MWTKLMKYLSEFPSAILSGCDNLGYPYSVRCIPIPDANKQVLQLQLSEVAALQPGPASLLCYEHDEWIDNMRSFVVRGTLEQGDGWLFRPEQFIPGVGIGFLGGMPNFARESRRVSKRYLEKRGLSRPQVDWDEVDSLWSKVK